MKEISEGNKIAIVLASVGLHKGTNWGLLKEETPGYDGMVVKLTTQDKDSNYRVVHHASNGKIVELEEDYLVNVIKRKEPKAITSEVEGLLQSRKKQEENKFKAYLSGIINGEIEGEDFEEHHISVFSLTNQMRLNGIDYPTFRITHLDVLEILKSLKKEIQDRVFIKLGETEFVPVSEIAAQGVGMERGLSIASTGTGVFLTIRVMEV